MSIQHAMRRETGAQAVSLNRKNQGPSARRVSPARRRRTFFSILLACVVFHSPDSLAREAGQRPEVRQDSHRRTASVDLEGCRTSLEYDAQWHSLHYRNTCPAPLSRKLDLLPVLLDALFPDARVPEEVRSLLIGRLVQFAPELSMELAAAAMKSPRWDARRGRVRDTGPQNFGRINAFVREIAIEARLFSPVADSLRKYGISASAGSVEKVLVGRPKDIPLTGSLMDRGAGEHDRLPFDAIVSLSLERLEKK